MSQQGVGLIFTIFASGFSLFTMFDIVLRPSYCLARRPTNRFSALTAPGKKMLFRVGKSHRICCFWRRPRRRMTTTPDAHRLQWRQWGAAMPSGKGGVAAVMTTVVASRHDYGVICADFPSLRGPYKEGFSYSLPPFFPCVSLSDFDVQSLKPKVE